MQTLFFLERDIVAAVARPIVAARCGRVRVAGGLHPHLHVLHAPTGALAHGVPPGVPGRARIGRGEAGVDLLAAELGEQLGVRLVARHLAQILQRAHPLLHDLGILVQRHTEAVARDGAVELLELLLLRDRDLEVEAADDAPTRAANVEGVSVAVGLLDLLLGRAVLVVNTQRKVKGSFSAMFSLLVGGQNGSSAVE